MFYLPALGASGGGVVAFVFLFNPGTGPVNTILKLFGIQGPLWFNDPAWSKPSLVLLGVWVMGDIMIIFLAALLDVLARPVRGGLASTGRTHAEGPFVTLP